jgi:hypothetical protein
MCYFFPVPNHTCLAHAGKPAMHLIYDSPPDFARRIRSCRMSCPSSAPLLATLEGAPLKQNIPLLGPPLLRACVLSPHLTHGLTLPNGTDHVRICLQVGKKGGTLSWQGYCKGCRNHAVRTSRAKEVVWRQLPGKNIGGTNSIQCQPMPARYNCVTSFSTVIMQLDTAISICFQ